MIRTLPNGIYVAKSDSECSPAELRRRLVLQGQIASEAYELFQQSQREQEIAAQRIYDLRFKEPVKLSAIEN